MTTKCTYIALVLLLCAAGSPWLSADPIPLRKFRLLNEGMSETEILRRVGAPDRETVIDNYHTYRKIWYYLPDGSYSGHWTTIITFNSKGRVAKIERERP